MNKKIIFILLFFCFVFIFGYVIWSNFFSSKYFPASEISKLYPVGTCCCDFLTDDMRSEELMLVSECEKRTKGVCVEINPLRSTPHSCCPGALGENCGSLIKK